MKKKKINIPIYCCKLTIILDKDLSYIENKYGTESLSNCGAVTSDEEEKNYIVAFTDNKDLSLIAHEVVHIKNAIYRDCYMQLDVKNDEPEAYLTAWLFEQIYNFLKK